MTTPVRFAYTAPAASRSDGNLLAHLPITLSHETHVLAVVGLLDTGSTVNVLTYPLGLQLGLVWEQQTTRVHLTGSLARLPARGVIVSGQVASPRPATERRKVVPVNVRLHGVEIRVRDGGHASDAEHEAILHKPMTSGR